MIDFMTFNIATGDLLQTMRATDIFAIDAQCDEFVSYIFGHWDRDIFMVREGQVVPR